MGAVRLVCLECDYASETDAPGACCPTHERVLVNAEVRERAAEHSILGQMVDGRVAVYDILSTSGGFGAVYLGIQQPLGREVVVKLIHPHIAALPGMRDRFLHEARMLQSIRAPEIVTVHDVLETAEGALCIVMERVPGRTLEAVLVAGEIESPLAALDVTVSTLEALTVAHRHGLVHRDLKPSNIMVGAAGEITLIDFGVAKQVAAKGGERQGPQTRTGMALGTPRYMAPEQVRSKGVVSARTDLYACGILLYELLAGHTPFDGSEGELLAAHLGQAPPPFSKDLLVHPALERLVMRALAKAPEDRYESAAEMREALLACRAALEASGPRARVKSKTKKVDVQAETIAASSDSVLTTDINWVVESRRKQAQTPIALAGLALCGFLVWAVIAEDGQGTGASSGVSRPAASAPVKATLEPTSSTAPRVQWVPDATTQASSGDAGGQPAVRRTSKVESVTVGPPPAGETRKPVEAVETVEKPKRVPRKRPRQRVDAPRVAPKVAPKTKVRVDAAVAEAPAGPHPAEASLGRTMEAALKRCRCGPARQLLKKMAPYPSLTKEWSPRVARCRPPLPDFGCRYTP